MCPSPATTAQFEAPAVPSGDKTVALTFDDGPGRSTQAILNILESFHVRATFFNVGQEEVYRPSLVAEEGSDGFLLGDHTVDHPEMTGLTAREQASEIMGVVTETRLIADTSPCVFRPPYGSYDATTLGLVRADRMSLWMWNVSTDDWEARGSGSAYWVHHIITTAESMGLATDHAVVLFHNQPILMPATVAALPVVISFFQQHGYQFVDLLGRTGPPGSCGAPTVTTPISLSNALGAGSTLRAGATISSPNGQFVLELQVGGNLVLRLATGRQLWSSGTGGHPGDELSVTAGGQVDVRARDGAILWSTGTSGHAGARLAVADDGVLSVQLGREVLWDSGAPLSQLLPGERLFRGWQLTSPNGRCRLSFRAGRLELRDATGQVLWSPAALAADSTQAVLKTNGNLVVGPQHAPAAWVSETALAGSTRLRLEDTGQLVISTVRGVVLWVTP